jgi:hypothetical protein
MAGGAFGYHESAGTIVCGINARLPADVKPVSMTSVKRAAQNGEPRSKAGQRALLAKLTSSSVAWGAAWPHGGREHTG